MSAPVLATERLGKRFGGVVATEDVTLAIAPGELRCIIGPNGAGKSTFFKLLCGLETPDQGRILFKGEDISRLPAFHRVRRGLGMTFQTNRTYHALSVRQNLATPMRVHRADRSPDAEARYALALERFGLDAEADHPARELPHHRLQWLEIAMVLASGPDLILLDEPTAGMSPDETRATAAVLRELNERGLTIVVVEHDIAFVREVAQAVTVLHQGRVFAQGSIDEITAHEDVRRIYLGRA
jgi:branched-chain amino acid transport system ATP-binding protein